MSKDVIQGVNVLGMIRAEELNEWPGFEGRHFATKTSLAYFIMLCILYVAFDQIHPRVFFVCS